MENNLDDPKNIAGLSNLLKDDDVDSNMDLAELEKEIANGACITQEEEINIAEEYKNEMTRLSRNFDIGMNITEPVKNEISPYASPINTFTTASPKVSPINTPKKKFNTFVDSPRNDQINTYINPKSHPVEKEKINWNAYNPEDYQLNNMTIEERKQDKINTVLYDIDDRDLEFNIDKEREEDDKASLLEQIDMLKITLEDDGIDVSGIPDINKNSSIKDVQNVYKILRLKNDRNRYCSFAEELILAGAYGMEHLFDGKKEWFNRQPDLIGWADTVKIKLRRMRFETSTFVQEIMQEYNMSAGVRLALELIPSMFLYSRSRRISQKDNLVSDNQYKDAISKLNEI
jgi:hypothetical protein